MTPVNSVPTIFPQFNVATRVNGYPIQRVTFWHGPSNHGKTVAMLGMGRSFLELDNLYFHVDAEMTTPEQWVREQLCEYADHPGFFALRPQNYEETADAVRAAAEKVAELRKSGAIDEHTTALFGIDSLQKLVPKKLMEEVSKSGGLDGRGGRGGMFQAAMNTAWMRELIPMLHHNNVGLMLIGRESDNTERTMPFEQTYKVGGGRAVYFDSSLVCRVTRAEWVTRGTKENRVVLGEKHLVQVMKTKVGHKDGKVTKCYFHTSNGQLIPPGFDIARDVLDLGLGTPILSKEKGGVIWDTEDGVKLGTINDAVVALTNDKKWLTSLRERVVAVAQPEEEAEVEE